MSDGALDGLLARLSSSDPWEQEQAAEALGALGDARAVPALCVALSAPMPAEPDDLGPEPGHAAVALVTARFEARDVRLAAARALGRIGDARAAGALRARVADAREHATVREAARGALDGLGPR
jgi:HEAT repeat protein